MKQREQIDEMLWQDINYALDAQSGDIFFKHDGIMADIELRLTYPIRDQLYNNLERIIKKHLEYLEAE